MMSDELFFLIASDDPDDGVMSLKEYFDRPNPTDTSAENVARCVRYLEWWFSIPQNIGLVTEDAIKTLMEFARSKESGT